MARTYEYSIRFEFYTPLMPITNFISKEEHQLEITKHFEKWVKGWVDTSLGEGWIPNSHNITAIGDTLLFSVFLQRHRE